MTEHITSRIFAKLSVEPRRGGAESVACEPRSETLSLRRVERGASRARGPILVAAGFSWQKLSEAIVCRSVSSRVALQPMAKTEVEER